MEIAFIWSSFLSFFITALLYNIGLQNILIGYFDKKYWEKEDEKIF